MPEPVYTVTLDEKRKRDAVLAALTDANNKHKLGLAAMIHGIPEKVLAHCVHHQSLGTLTQAQINWLAVDLRN